MKLYFVLVAPPARPTWALPPAPWKTMGFDAMRLVASRVHEEEEASWVAHGAQEVLTQAEAFDTLEEALADMDLVVATTARQRSSYQHYLTPVKDPRPDQGQAVAGQGRHRVWLRGVGALQRAAGPGRPHQLSAAQGELPVPEPGARRSCCTPTN